jgi:hypothetical protein
MDTLLKRTEYKYKIYSVVCKCIYRIDTHAPMRFAPFKFYEWTALGITDTKTNAGDVIQSMEQCFNQAKEFIEACIRLNITEIKK